MGSRLREERGIGELETTQQPARGGRPLRRTDCREQLLAEEFDQDPQRSRAAERLALTASAVHLAALLAGIVIVLGTGQTWPAFAVPGLSLAIAAFVAWRVRRW